MPSQVAIPSPAPASGQGLRAYYFLRAAVSVGWIALAATAGQAAPAAAAALLVAYPAWDALANYLDARAHGGLRANSSQALNLVASAVTALAVVVALGAGMGAVIAVFGAWAILSGVFQLLTALRRWTQAGGQWLMALSGVQSALAGLFFFMKAAAQTPPDILAIAPYAGFGAFYFLASALWLTFRRRRAA